MFQVSSARTAGFLPKSLRKSSKSGFFNENTNAAVSSELKPCCAREREILSRNSRTGAQGALSRLVIPSLATAVWSRARNSRVCAESSASVILRSSCKPSANSLIHPAWMSRAYFFKIACVRDGPSVIEYPPKSFLRVVRATGTQSQFKPAQTVCDALRPPKHGLHTEATITRAERARIAPIAAVPYGTTIQLGSERTEFPLFH